MAHSRRSTRFASVTVICGVAVGLLAGTASGSTAQFVDVVIPPECKYVPPGFTCLPGSAKVLVYRGGPGEANVVRLTGSGDAARIDDPAAVIDPGDRCSAIDAHSVSCPAPDAGGVYRVYVSTGSGADTISSSLPGPVIADGGPGNDVLLGGPSGDVLYGGRGADALRGGDGDDGLHDASPREPLRSGDLDPYLEERPTVVALADPGRGRDSFDGGLGQDTVSYEGRSAGVRVALADTAAIGGARGEHDSVKSVQNAVGGAGDDRLAGNRRKNSLDGAGGDDRIVAGHGNDYIEGGSGRNVIIAGPGDDTINTLYHPSDQGAERVLCGPGSDLTSSIVPSEFLNDDCEQLLFTTFGERLVAHEVRSLLPLRARRPPTVLSATLECAPFDVHAPCHLGLEVRVHGPAARRGTAPPRGTLLGSRSDTFSLGEKRSVSLGLSPVGVELLRRHRALRVRVTATGAPPYGPTGYLTVLRAP
jgi:Ca2+-binding RTX toxin-like protein